MVSHGRAYSRRLAVCVMGLVVLTSWSTARGDTELRWKFKPGEKSNFEMKMDMVQETKAGDMPISVKVNQILEMTWDTKEVADDGTGTLNLTINRLRMEMAMPQGQSLKYDSSAAEKPPGSEMFAKLFDAMVGKPFMLRVTPLGKVEDFKAPDEMLAAMKNSPLAQAGGTFSEEGLKQMITQTMLPLPPEPVKDGATWETKGEVDTPPFGKQLTTTTYTFAGATDRDGKSVDKIDVALDVEIKPAADAQAKLALKNNKAGGEVYWDNAAGKPIEANVNSTMTLQLTVGGQSLDQTVTTKSTMKQVPAAEREL